VAVAYFVVVPGHDFNEVTINDAGEAEIDDRGLRAADDVRGHQWFVGDGQNTLIGRGAGGVNEHLVYLFDRGGTGSNEGKIGNGTGNDGDAQGEAVKQTFEFGDRFGGGNSGAGRSGDDVGGGGTSAAEIAMRIVLKILVVGVAVDGHKHGFFDADFGVHDSGDRGDAVGGATGIRENGNRIGVLFEDGFVHPQNNGGDAIAPDRS